MNLTFHFLEDGLIMSALSTSKLFAEFQRLTKSYPSLFELTNSSGAIHVERSMFSYHA